MPAHNPLYESTTRRVVDLRLRLAYALSDRQMATEIYRGQLNPQTWVWRGEPANRNAHIGHRQAGAHAYRHCWNGIEACKSTLIVAARQELKDRRLKLFKLIWDKQKFIDASSHQILDKL